ncbi:MAG: HTH domain-containing protein [Flavobacteriales bacterium]|nr:HTH domain-containing protein [Flavobacteriales bacterium]
MLLEKLQKLIYLIERKQTGRPRLLASQLGVSRRMVYHYLVLLREETRAPIEFDNFKESFVFTQSGKLHWQFTENIALQENAETLKNRQIVRLTELVAIIHAQKTGSVTDLAQRFGIAERTIYYYIDVLRHKFSCPISFDRKKNSYVFTRPGTLNFLWQSEDGSVV